VGVIFLIGIRVPVKRNFLYDKLKLRINSRPEYEISFLKTYAFDASILPTISM